MADWIPYLQDPLILVGFVVFLLSGFCRLLIKKGVVPPLSPDHGFLVLNRIIVYGFLVGILVIALGFGLKYRQLSKNEQLKAVSLLRDEISGNKQVVKSLAVNTEKLTELYLLLADDLLRNPDNAILQTLFPRENLVTTIDSEPTPAALADAAIDAMESRATEFDQNESEQLAALGKAATGMCGRIRDTVESLADESGKRYVIRRDALNANLAIIRRIAVADLSNVQTSYNKAEDIREKYSVIVRSVIRYLDAVGQLFSRIDAPSRELLVNVLTHERFASSLLVTYGNGIVDTLASFDSLEDAKALRPQSQPAAE